MLTPSSPSGHIGGLEKQFPPPPLNHLSYATFFLGGGWSPSGEGGLP
jgi:hypothetical protein